MYKSHMYGNYLLIFLLAFPLLLIAAVVTFPFFLKIHREMTGIESLEKKVAELEKEIEESKNQNN